VVLARILSIGSTSVVAPIANIALSEFAGGGLGHSAECDEPQPAKVTSVIA
jgi:hypothetical protein